MTQRVKHLNTVTISTINRWVAAIVCLLFVSGTSTALLAANIQSHDVIKQTIHDYLQDKTSQLSIQPKIKVGQLDSRLRLHACNKPLQAFTPDGSKLQGRTTVGVRCQGDQPWSIYVPATIAIYEEIVVTTTPLMRGHLVGTSDIQLEKREVGKMSGQHFIHDMDWAIGKVLKRPISAGKIIQSSYLEMPRLIKRGQMVTILAVTDGLVVKMSGKSMMDGVKGDLIQVQNPKTKRIINGTVTDSGEVRVNL